MKKNTNFTGTGMWYNCTFYNFMVSYDEVENLCNNYVNKIKQRGGHKVFVQPCCTGKVVSQHTHERSCPRKVT